MRALLPRLITAASLSLLSTTGLGEELPEIIVTADFRAASELETSTSVTVLTSEIIREREANHLEELLGTIPNVNFAMGSTRARFLQIRGIGERSQFGDPLNPSVGMMVDHVDFSGFGTVATMLDVDQVEVLRGPQGTRYGANALAGLVNIRTNDPEATFGANARVSVADYGTSEIAAVITGGLSDNVRGRLAIGTHQSDGYYDNSFLGVDDTNDRDELTLRTKLAIDVSADWQVMATLSHVDVDNGYDAFSLDNVRTTLSDEPGHDRQESTAFSIDSSWSMSDAELQLIAAVSTSDIEYGYDEDWSFTGIHPFGYTSTDNYQRDRDTRSLELRWIAENWVAGVYYLASDEDLTRTYTFLPGPFTSTYDYDTLAAFAEYDVNFSDATSLTVGLRAERRDTTYADSDAVAFEPSDNLWGGRIALNHFLSDETLTYLSVARGYKAGGFNTDGTLDADLREFGEEYLIEYEAGIKASLNDNALNVRAAIFMADRNDQQVKSSIVRPRPDGSTEFIDFTGNAASGTNRGIEIETNWQANDVMRVRAAAGFLDATFDNFINEFGDDLSGRDQAQSPAWMYSLGADFNQGNWFASLSIDGKDDYFFSDRHTVRSDSYHLVNARVGMRFDNWSVSAWGRNLTDEDVLTRGFGSFGNDPRKNYVTEPYFQFGEPRLIGVTVEASLGQ